MKHWKTISSKQITTFVFLAIILCALVFSVWPDNEKTESVMTLVRDQIKYHGQVEKNSFDGAGTLMYKNKDKYIGNFKDGRFNGAGTFYSHEGWFYRGVFKDGEATGKGTLHLKKGKVLEGSFKNGAFQEDEKK
jgi:hypothetical protein